MEKNNQSDITFKPVIIRYRSGFSLSMNYIALILDCEIVFKPIMLIRIKIFSCNCLSNYCEVKNDYFLNPILLEI